VSQLQMLEIRVPESFEAAVLDKVIRNVERVTLTFKRNSTLERQEIRRINAEANLAVAQINSNTTKRATILRAQAAADAQLKFATDRATILRTVSARLGFVGGPGINATLGANSTSDQIIAIPQLLQFLMTEVTRG